MKIRLYRTIIFEVFKRKVIFLDFKNNKIRYIKFKCEINFINNKKKRNEISQKIY